MFSFNKYPRLSTLISISSQVFITFSVLSSLFILLSPTFPAFFNVKKVAKEKLLVGHHFIIHCSDESVQPAVQYSYNSTQSTPFLSIGASESSTTSVFDSILSFVNGMDLNTILSCNSSELNVIQQSIHFNYSNLIALEYLLISIACLIFYTVLHLTYRFIISTLFSSITPRLANYSKKVDSFFYLVFCGIVLFFGLYTLLITLYLFIKYPYNENVDYLVKVKVFRNTVQESVPDEYKLEGRSDSFFTLVDVFLVNYGKIVIVFLSYIFPVLFISTLPKLRKMYGYYYAILVFFSLNVFSFLFIRPQVPNSYEDVASYFPLVMGNIKILEALFLIGIACFLLSYYIMKDSESETKTICLTYFSFLTFLSYYHLFIAVNYLLLYYIPLDLLN